MMFTKKWIVQKEERALAHQSFSKDSDVPLQDDSKLANVMAC